MDIERMKWFIYTSAGRGYVVVASISFAEIYPACHSVDVRESRPQQARPVHTDVGHVWFLDVWLEDMAHEGESNPCTSICTLEFNFVVFSLPISERKSWKLYLVLV